MHAQTVQSPIEVDAEEESVCKDLVHDLPCLRVILRTREPMRNFTGRTPLSRLADHQAYLRRASSPLHARARHQQKAKMANCCTSVQAWVAYESETHERVDHVG
jgi:hypothetical protein